MRNCFQSIILFRRIRNLRKLRKWFCRKYMAHMCRYVWWWKRWKRYSHTNPITHHRVLFCVTPVDFESISAIARFDILFYWTRDVIEKGHKNRLCWLSRRSGKFGETNWCSFIDGITIGWQTVLSAILFLGFILIKQIKSNYLFDQREQFILEPLHHFLTCVIVCHTIYDMAVAQDCRRLCWCRTRLLSSQAISKHMYIKRIDKICIPSIVLNELVHLWMYFWLNSTANRSRVSSPPGDDYQPSINEYKYQTKGRMHI